MSGEPRFSPPAWAVLYLTIAVSGWLVWRKVGFAGAVLPLAIYLVQFVLNAAWSPIFFGLRRPDLAFIEIIMLWMSIVATIAAFHPVNATAAWLLLPYLAWVTFAAALNFAAGQFHQARGNADLTADYRAPPGELFCEAFKRC